LSLSPRDGISKTVRSSPLETGYRRTRCPQVMTPRPRPTASAFRVLRQGSATTCVKRSFSAWVYRLDKETLPTGRQRPPNRPFPPEVSVSLFRRDPRVMTSPARL
jgi:hypothetical protein